MSAKKKAPTTFRYRTGMKAKSIGVEWAPGADPQLFVRKKDRVA